MNLMLPLAKRHRITYLARSDDVAKDREAAVFLADHGIKTILVPAPLPAKEGSSFYFRLAANLFSPLPYSVATHVSRAMREAVAAHAARHPVDLWQLEWQGYSYCVERLAGPTVIQAHNIDALIWQRYLELETRVLPKRFIAHQLTKFREFERRALRAADRVVAVSDADANLARNLYGPLAIDVVDNGVDVSRFAGIETDPNSHSILFLGALDWRPNQDAATYFLDAVLPGLRQAIPSVRFVVVGRNPPAWLKERIGREKAATIHSDVDDVRPYLEKSAVMIVPLRVGGGTRLKILEALAAGLPVVTTSTGAEGLRLLPGIDLTIADTASEMIASISECITSRSQARARAWHGRATVTSMYDWTLLADRLDAIWQDIIRSNRPQNSAPQPSSVAKGWSDGPSH